MKALTAIFSRDANIAYLLVCLDHWQASKSLLASIFPSLALDLLIVDFSKEESSRVKDACRQYGGDHKWKPGAGFCHNMNYAFNSAVTNGHNYVVSINDDAMIAPNFLVNGFRMITTRPDLGFIGGIPNKGKWQLSLDQLNIPPERNELYRIEPLRRLWWEASAGIYSMEAILEVGQWDEVFDECGGVCSDNDYFFRMQEAGHKLYRYGRMPFFHCKGVTQGDFRIPVPGRQDPLKAKNILYFQRKWGVLLEPVSTSTKAPGIPLEEKGR